jgi:hypothetical protein
MSWWLFDRKNDPSTNVPVPAAPPEEALPVTGNIAIVRPANMESTCPAPGVFGAVDLCQPVTQHFLDVMKYLGVKTIIRYYDNAIESLRGKTPHAEELALIKKNGFKMLAVFQHSNNSIVTFETPGRGTKDALRSLELANLWNQPKNSCIYFGVDFDPSLGHEMTAVKSYASDFGKLVREAGYRVGTYGSGLTLETLLDAKLIDLAWLSMSTGFQQSKSFASGNRWALHQVKDRNCGNINVDFNYVSGDIGDWEIQ